MLAVTLATEELPTQKLNWKTDSPVWVEQWPLSKEKLKALQELVDEQLAKGHIVETTSPWNSTVFVIKKANKGKWRLLHDLRQINNVIEDMGSLQPGMPSPVMLPQNWNLAIIDIKDCFFQIPLHPDDALRFIFLVPTLNREAPRKRYHWKFLPQGMKNSPSVCQWYLSSLLSPVRAAVGEAIVLHYMDDVLMCAPNDDLLSHALDLTIDSLVAAGFELQEEKIERMLPWKYLGLEIGKRTIVPQKLVVKNNIRTLADVQQLCGSLNWVRPWLGLTTEDLDPLFNLLKGGEELSSPRTLTQEARAALEKVQDCMATRQANRCKSDLPFKFIISGNLPHLHGMIFQWERVEKSKKDKDCREPLLIIEWVFLSHHQSKRMTRPQELVAELIRKARTWIRELAGCDFECIHIPIEINSGQITKAMLEHLLHENESLQFALDSYTGEKSSDAMKHLIQAFSFLGIPKSIKTNNGPTYTFKEFGSFLQQWGVEHKTGIPYSPTGQAIVERTHQNLKRVLSQQHQLLKIETPQIQLSKALSTLNFLNCTYENLNPLIVHLFRENCQLQLKAKPQEAEERESEPGRNRGISSFGPRKDIGPEPIGSGVALQLGRDHSSSIVEKYNNWRSFRGARSPKGPPESWRHGWESTWPKNLTQVPIQPDGSFQPYSKIKQLPSEPFVTFVERLTRAIELQVKNEGAQEQVLEEMALADADEQCKAAILSLSIQPASALHDMLQQKSPDVIVKDPVTRGTKSLRDQVTWGRGYAYVSAPPDLKWVPAEWVKPFIPKTAKPPAEAPQVASAAWRRRKHRTFSF
ncbi:hypothetical protein DUI87_30932 [Hirundo rustica rustica]|uniref:ribonuclease H n=2 Tax=Sylvioidea TaxID=2116661 RepID=A0A3M0J0V3_HIRRU|nr:hypothetical protein DUI87_30932 [Hirundo rustica rustica]